MLADIIPEAFYHARGDAALWLIALGAMALLAVGADRAVGAAARLATVLGLSKVIIGATIVSLGTTAPEAAVSVSAAFKGDGGLALGNAVGSIICDTALIFGLGCCLVRLPKDRFVLRRHGWLQLGAGVLLAGVLVVLWALAGDIRAVQIPRVVGFAFLALLAGYLYLSVRWSRRHPQMVPLEAEVKVEPTRKARQAVGNLLIVAIGLGLVVGGSEVLIGSAKTICQRYGVPQAVIAVTVVAIGTSLPELVTAIASILKGHSELLVGNIIGADILNVLFVIGASAAAVPLKVDPLFYTFLVPMMLVVLIMLRIFIFMPGNTFRRWQGIPLLAAYAVFLAVTLWLGLGSE